MAIIIGSKTTKDGNIILEVKTDYKETLQLKGHIQNITLFSEDTAQNKTNISGRGKNSATKYFLIPRELRQNLKFPQTVKVQKIETPTKATFIYIVDKLTTQKTTPKSSQPK
jgi:hypothetical protein